jgi:hypothetical protein
VTNVSSLLAFVCTGAVLLSMHQYAQPLRDCILEMKSFQPQTQVEPTFALKKLFTEGLVEFINLIIAILLFRFTGMDKPGDFSSRPYFIAALLVPICISLFFTTERCGCAIDSDSSQGILENDSSPFAKTDRQFPVAVIYHLIVTVCYWFMKVGMDSCNANLEEVTKMKKQLSKKSLQKKRK